MSASNEMEKLCKVLNFGADCLSQANIDLKKIRIRKRLLFMMVCAAHNYTESIFSLCKEDRTHSCFVLIRSLVENRINAKALFASNSLDGVYGYILYSYEEHKKMLNRQLDLKKVLPAAQIQVNIPDGELVKAIKQVDRYINKIKKRCPRMLDCKNLYTRSDAIDKYNTMKGASSASLRWEYDSIYRLYCEPTHLTLKGLMKFVSVDQSGCSEVFLSGNSKDLVLIVQHAFYLYVDVLKMFLVCFKSPFRKELKNYI